MSSLVNNSKFVNPNKYLGNELDYLTRVLNAESWSAHSGSWANTLEAKFAERMGSRYAVAMNSGTATLHAALIGVGVEPGAEVISPALTVIMDATATLHANAVPIFADVDPLTFNVCPKSVEGKITDRTQAIIVVSLYGLPANLPELRAIADKHGLPLIEDNAQCVLGDINGRLVGTFGDIASYSFETTKHLSCGEGGMITTDDEQVATRARKLGGHGFKNLAAAEGRTKLNLEVFQNPLYERHDELGWNYRLNEFSAAVALAQLERVDNLVAMREKSAHWFLEAMKESEILVPQLTPTGYRHTYYTLAATYHGEELAGVSWVDFRREYFAMTGEGIYSAWQVPYLEPLISTGAFKQRVSPAACRFQYTEYRRGLCPTAEGVQRRIMQFKTNYRDERIAQRMADQLHTLLRKYG
jgi:perosamine synthetase